MTPITTKHLVSRQLPGFVRETAPLFQKFLEYYYEFQEQAKIPDIIQEVRKYNDIDAADEQFLIEFFEELKVIPQAIVADKRLVAKHIYDIYKTKGSETSLKLLFKIVYGEDITVSYPSDDILRTSDGRWIQDNIFTLNPVQGEYSATSNRIKFNNAQGNFEFEIKRSEAISETSSRFFFEPKKNYFIEPNQLVQVYTNETLDYVGRVSSMPASIEVVNGGGSWQVGQVIIIPGPVKDMVCQIKRTGEKGSILKIDIVDFGAGYLSDETFIISPYRFKPTSSYIEALTETLSSSPIALAHTLNIVDIGEGVIDTILGRSSNQQYVTVGYPLPNYINDAVIRENTTPVVYDPAIVNTEISIDEWLSSLAIIRVRNKNFAKAAGYYADFRGQLSVPNIRLQDNFFYQIFSYVIETYRSLKEYKSVISTVHPAGMKYFANQKKEVSFSITPSVSRILSRELLLLSSEVVTADNIVKGYAHTLADSVVPSDTNSADSYDGNNSLALYDPSSENDWDEITALGTVDEYTLENYDNQTYDITSSVVEQYTQEEQDISFTITRSTD